MQAFLNQTNCDSCYHAAGPRCELLDNRLTNNAQAQNSLFNCAVLNRAPAYFDGGVLPAPPPGTYRYMSTRNNNFSNRSQKVCTECLSERTGRLLTNLVRDFELSQLVAARLRESSKCCAGTMLSSSQPASLGEPLLFQLWPPP